MQFLDSALAERVESIHYQLNKECRESSPTQTDSD